MTTYKDRLQRRERPQPQPDIPPIGATVVNSSGGVGIVTEHVVRPNRPVVVRVKFSSKHGSYLPSELEVIDPASIAS